MPPHPPPPQPCAQVQGGIPDCSTGVWMDSPCYDFIYTPMGDATVETLVANIRANNAGRAIPVDRTRGFASTAAADAFLYANPRRVLAGIHFNISADGLTIGYGLQARA